MKVRRSLALLVALASLAAPMSAVSAAPTPTERITGLDGILYDSAPAVVTGLAGDLYAGFELDYACGLGGRKLAKSIDQLAKLAELLTKSGRRVVYTVAPGKTWGLTDHLDPATLPHGLCDSTGVAQQNKVLDEKRPHYLPLRPLLTGTRRGRCTGRPTRTGPPSAPLPTPRGVARCTQSTAGPCPALHVHDRHPLGGPGRRAGRPHARGGRASDPGQRRPGADRTWCP